MNDQITLPAAHTRDHVATGQHADSDQLGFMNLYRVYRRVLDEDESRALALVELENASYEQIGELLGKTHDQVKLIVFTARKKMFFGMGRTLGELERQSVA